MALVRKETIKVEVKLCYHANFAMAQQFKLALFCLYSIHITTRHFCKCTVTWTALKMLFIQFLSRILLVHDSPLVLTGIAASQHLLSRRFRVASQWVFHSWPLKEIAAYLQALNSSWTTQADVWLWKDNENILLSFGLIYGFHSFIFYKNIYLLRVKSSLFTKCTTF